MVQIADLKRFNFCNLLKRVFTLFLFACDEAKILRLLLNSIQFDE
jgi:hypothetical protein